MYDGSMAGDARSESVLLIWSLVCHGLPRRHHGASQVDVGWDIVFMEEDARQVTAQVSTISHLPAMPGRNALCI